MRAKELSRRYFDWLYQLVCIGAEPHRKLIAFLHSQAFVCEMARDANRAEDGVELRYRFGYEKGIRRENIERYLDRSPCSVLEMMAALALRCENHIMRDSEIGDRSRRWFREMLENLGFGRMTDDIFDEGEAKQIVERFLQRRYQPDGRGGLFIIQNCPYDLRTVEIWYQAMWYLNESMQTFDTAWGGTTT